MYIAYKQRNDAPDNVTFKSGNTYISFESGSGNRFDVEYQAWLAEGNQPEIVNIDEPPDVPTIDERVEAVELMVDLLLDTQQESA